MVKIVYLTYQTYLQNNSEYTGLLNHWLLKLEESGVKEIMWKSWTNKASEDFWFEEPIQLGYGNLVLMIILFMGGIGISILTVVCENMVKKHQNAYTKRKLQLRHRGRVG